MSGNTEKLVDIVSPPAKGREVDWHAFEESSGFTVPADYKEIVETYGPGVFDRFLWILQPLARNKNLDIKSTFDADLRSLVHLKNDCDEEVPYQLEPTSQLIPWAVTENGDTCYWFVNDTDPDKWIVVTNESRDPNWQEFDLGMGEFLVGIFTGEIECDILSEFIMGGASIFQTESESRLNYL